MQSHPESFDPWASEHGARLADVGAHLARVVHELSAPTSLVHGSVDNLTEYLHTLLRYLSALEERFGNPVDLATLRAETGAEYASANAEAVLRICAESVRRLVTLVGELRAWTAHPAQPLSVRPVDVRQVLDDAIGLAESGRAAALNVETDLPDGLPPVLASAQSLGQVLVNVVGNALDAVDGTERPSVRVTAHATSGDPEMVGEFVEIRVRDNGPGVPAAQRERIFEPFFTTKCSGAGLGLGLAIAREILQRSGGSIALSGNGPGAEFVIRLRSAAAGFEPGAK